MSETHSGGIAFLIFLTVLFIGLKLTGYIHWSWAWVLAPVWICGSIAALIVGALILCAGMR